MPAAAREVERGPNPPRAAWPRLNGNTIFKAPLSIKE
jgi:hypothetical protein